MASRNMDPLAMSYRPSAHINSHRRGKSAKSSSAAAENDPVRTLHIVDAHDSKVVEVGYVDAALLIDGDARRIPKLSDSAAFGAESEAARAAHIIHSHDRVRAVVRDVDAAAAIHADPRAGQPVHRLIGRAGRRSLNPFAVQ